MAARLHRVVARTVSLASFAAVTASVQAQSVEQLLDRVVTYNRSTLLEMEFGAADPTAPDFTRYPVSPVNGFAACDANGTRGLYCLDGQDVRRWPDPPAGGPGQVEFSCTNPALALDVSAGNACSTMTVAQNGDAWIAGRRNSGYSLIKLVARDADGSCDEGVALDPQPGIPARYCFREYATGQRRLVDLVAVDGDRGDVFDPGTGEAADGVLALDELGAVTFFGASPSDAPRVLVAGRAAWGLPATASLYDLALLQLAHDDGTDNHLLATTSGGKVLAKQTDEGAPTAVVMVFDIRAEREQPSAPAPRVCDSTTQRFGITTDGRSSRAYVTDHKFCQVLALEPTDGDATDEDAVPLASLVNVARDGVDLTLSTVDRSGIAVRRFPPDAATVAPGIQFDLRDCRESCVLIADEDGTPLARLFDVQLSSPQSHMVVFHGRNIPDCRYVPEASECVGRDAVIGPPGDPGAQYLDLSKVLPSDITDQFEDFGAPPGLPPLLISPQFRATAQKDFRFGVVFGRTEEGVVFIDTFEGEWDVAGLSGSELGCQVGYGLGTPLAELLDQDVVTTASERYISVGGPNGLEPPAAGEPDYRYVDTIVNNGCGSTRSGGGRWSFVAYDLEITHNPTPTDDQDDVFALLVRKLFQDLGQTQRDIACRTDVDAPGSGPLDPTTCAALDASLAAAGQSLEKCISSAYPPSTISPDYFCRQFTMRFEAYRALVDEIDPGTALSDPANRIGELEWRAGTVAFLFRERFLPSIPPGLFTP